MELVMLIENKLIDSTPVEFKLLCEPGYLESLKIQLEEKHSLLVECNKGNVIFYVEGVPSAMNK